MAGRARPMLLAVVLLAAGVASGHAVAFNFLEPSSAGNPTDGGLFTFRWLDGADPAGSTLVQLFVSRPSLQPWGLVDGGTTLAVTSGAIAIADPANAFTWDSAGTPSGCYQPWAQMTDPLEGTSTISASGLVTVIAGSNVPPSVWVTNPLAAAPSDAGFFSLTFRIDDPDDATLVTLEAQQSTGAPVRLATDLPFPIGGGAGSFPVDTRALGAGAWFLHALVRDGDGGTCDAWWPGTLYLSAAADAGVDAGLGDAGSDGGTGGAGGGGTVSPPCGCASAGPLSTLAVASVLARAWRRRRAPGSG